MKVKATAFEDLGNPYLQGVLSEDEQAAIEGRKKALDKIFQEAGKARYKVELLLGHRRAAYGPSPGCLTFWESGSKLHGGGDAMMHLCPGKHLNKNDCSAFIGSEGHVLGNLVCSACGQVWPGEQGIGQLLFVLTTQNWATVLLKYYHQLGCNADLVLKYHPQSLVRATTKEREHFKGGELMNGVRGKRITSIYPLANIIKDTSAGADLYGRILAFLRA